MRFSAHLHSLQHRFLESLARAAKSDCAQASGLANFHLLGASQLHEDSKTTRLVISFKSAVRLPSTRICWMLASLGAAPYRAFGESCSTFSRVSRTSICTLLSAGCGGRMASVAQSQRSPSEASARPPTSRSPASARRLLDRCLHCRGFVFLKVQQSRTAGAASSPEHRA